MHQNLRELGRICQDGPNLPIHRVEVTLRRALLGYCERGQCGIAEYGRQGVMAIADDPIHQGAYRLYLLELVELHSEALALCDVPHGAGEASSIAHAHFTQRRTRWEADAVQTIMQRGDALYATPNT